MKYKVMNADNTVPKSKQNKRFINAQIITKSGINGQIHTKKSNLIPSIFRDFMSNIHE